MTVAVSNIWVASARRRHTEDLIHLEAMNPADRVVCRICNGSADPQCGCDGTMSAAEAIAYANFNLEILSK